MTSSSRPKVIFLSASVGAGHNSAARALQAQLARMAPSLDTTLVDALDLSRPPFRLCYAGSYTTTASRMPWLYGLGYWVTDRPDGPGRSPQERVRLATEWAMLRPLRKWLVSQGPALVVCTHYLAAPVVGRMIRQGHDDLRQVVVVTDNELHRWWYSENVERYFVPVDACRRRLMDYGIEPDRIELAGIPVHPKWREPLDTDRLRAEWNLPADRPVVLLTGGAQFTVGRIDRIAQHLLSRQADLTVVALAGGNKGLLCRLASLPDAQGPNPRLRVLGFTDRVHELVQLAWLVVTKPGGLMTSECLAKGTPMVLMKPVPGQEAANARMFQQQGAALVAATPEQLVQRVIELLHNRQALDELARNARRLDHPATATIAQRILEYAGRGG